MPKIVRPRIKITWIASLIIGVVSWVLWTSFWIALPCSIVLAIGLTFLINISFYKTTEKFFEKYPKRFLFWQDQYLYRTISLYERMKKDRPRITKGLAPIPGVPEVGPWDIILSSSVSQAELINRQSAAYLARFEYTFQEAEINYKKAIQYLSENNLPLPLGT